MQTKLIVKIPLNSNEFNPNTIISDIDSCSVDLVDLVKVNFENVELAVEVGD